MSLMVSVEGLLQAALPRPQQHRCVHAEAFGESDGELGAMPALEFWLCSLVVPEGRRFPALRLGFPISKMGGHRYLLSILPRMRQWDGAWTAQHPNVEAIVPSLGMLPLPRRELQSPLSLGTPSHIMPALTGTQKTGSLS